MATERVRRLGILTGGGDAPGLNAVIRAVVLTARGAGVEVSGVLDGFSGLVEGRFLLLDRSATRGLIRRGGTILGTTNRDNPFKFRGANGQVSDRSRDVLGNARAEGLDALVVIGGDGSLHIANELSALGLPLVGVPKTIDNDIEATDFTFGFWTAIETATDALDRLRDTAESHHRVMVLEVMGRNAGWIALYAGVAGAADVILIPEIPFRIDAVEAAIEGRVARGQAYSLIVVAEGAVAQGGEPSYLAPEAGDGSPRLGGAGERLAKELAPRVEHEVRCMVLGHLQRGGPPVPFDRILATRLGAHAARLAIDRRWGRMACVRGGALDDVPIAAAIARAKRVDPASELVAAARAVGIGFGDEP